MNLKSVKLYFPKLQNFPKPHQLRDSSVVSIHTAGTLKKIKEEEEKGNAGMWWISRVKCQQHQTATCDKSRFSHLRGRVSVFFSPAIIFTPGLPRKRPSNYRRVSVFLPRAYFIRGNVSFPSYHAPSTPPPLYLCRSTVVT